MIARAAGLAALLLGLAPSGASAQTINVNVNVDSDAASSVGLDPDALNSGIQDILSGDLQLDLVEPYLAQMAEAAAFSSRGMGVDYASNPKRILFGVGVGAAVTGLSVDSLFGRGDRVLPAEGYAAQITLMGGVNLGMFNDDKNFLDRLRLYGNFLTARPPSSQPIRGTLRNVGLNLQVKVLGPVDVKVVELGGLDITAGLQSSSYILELTQDLPLSGSESGVDVRWDGQGDYRLRSRAFSVPIEASTNVRILFITVFGGVGLDLTDAVATARAELSGDVYGARSGEQEVRLGDATVTGEARGRAEGVSARGFVGTQLDVLFLKLYGQVNFDGRDRLGAHAGLRAVF